MIKDRIQKVAGLGAFLKGAWRIGKAGVKAPGNISKNTGNRIMQKAISRGTTDGTSLIKLEPQDLRGFNKVKYNVGLQLAKHPNLYGYGIPLATTGAVAYGAKKIKDANTPFYQPTLDLLKEYGGKAGDWIKKNPGTAGLIGLGLVGVPLLSSLFDDGDDEDDRPRRRRRYL